ncbi:MAG: FHA domain-containing protein [Myxococcota bacterium]|jgi:pSer/pThr/pTyr-binding forkhead associated (FHA) protein|nr:FHA domain-containing protein [Myxococcota bacterium]
MPIRLTTRLTATAEASFEQEFDLGEITVGRSARCSLQLPFTFVSAQHFTIIAEGSSYLIADQGSTNGTVLNDKRLVPFAYAQLAEGDRISLGEIHIELHFVESVAQSLSQEQASLEMRRMVWEMLGADDDEAKLSIDVLSGPDRGSRHVLEPHIEQLVIGRDPSCDLVLTDPACSPRHIELFFTPSGFCAKALDNQLVLLNAQPLLGEMPLGKESVLVLAESRLLFRDPLKRYLDEIARLPEERPIADELRDVLTTQQISTPSFDAMEAPAVDFGPPNRPPVPAQPKLKDEDIAASPERARWGAFEISLLLLTALILVGGTAAILLLFGLL